MGGHPSAQVEILQPVRLAGGFICNSHAKAQIRQDCKPRTSRLCVRMCFQDIEEQPNRSKFCREAKPLPEELAQYIVRAGFFRERNMVCIPAENSAGGSLKAVYRSEEGGTEKNFDDLYARPGAVSYAAASSRPSSASFSGVGMPVALSQPRPS